MTEIMQSTCPEWCELIISGKKTIDVRKTRPKCNTPFKVYIYCTNDRKIMLERSNYDKSIYLNVNIYYPYKMDCSLNGKVIGEYICDAVQGYPFVDEYEYTPYHNIDKSELEKTCLSVDEFETYGDGKTLYGWHISDLQIYDTPKDIREFYHPCPYTEKPCALCKYADYSSGELECRTGIDRPPQSWCYVHRIG